MPLSLKCLFTSLLLHENREMNARNKTTCIGWQILEKSGKNMKIYCTKMLPGFLKYTLFFSFRGHSLQKPLFLNFADIKCPRTELKKHPFSLKFRMHERTHSQRYVRTPIPKYRHYDIAYCFIIVHNKSHTLCCRRKEASVFQAY